MNKNVPDYENRLSKQATGTHGGGFAAEHAEIERKFLIRMPELAELTRTAQRSEIEQTYLAPDKDGVRARVRKRRTGEKVEYIYTEKTFVTDLTRIEKERTISEGEYTRLLDRADPERRTIRKSRFCLLYDGQLFEIDVFPFWKRQAFMELEMECEDQMIRFPPMLEIIREVTHDGRYTNSALARSIPDEDPI